VECMRRLGYSAAWNLEGGLALSGVDRTLALAA